MLILIFLTLSFAGSCVDLEKICYSKCASSLSGSSFIFSFLESCLESVDQKILSCYVPPGCSCAIPTNILGSSSSTCIQRSCSVDWNTLIPSSTKWCSACADNCNGYQNNCINDGKFCRINNRCAGLSMCSRWRDNACLNGVFSNETCSSTTATYSPTVSPTTVATATTTYLPTVSPTVAPTTVATATTTYSPTVLPTTKPTDILPSYSYSPTVSTVSPTVSPVTTATATTVKPDISTISPTATTAPTDYEFKIFVITISTINMLYCVIGICIVLKLVLIRKHDTPDTPVNTISKNVYTEKDSDSMFIDSICGMDSSIDQEILKRKIKYIELKNAHKEFKIMRNEMKRSGMV